MRTWPLPTCAIAAAVVIGTIGWWVLAHQAPAPGQRSFTPQYVWAVRCAALGLASAAQAVLFGLALPALYRPRTAYTGLTFASMATALLAGATAGGLALAAG